MIRRMFALLLCAALVFGLVGCAQEEKPAATPTETTAPPVTEPSAADLYAQAKAPLLEAANLELDIDVIKTVNLGGETFRLTSEQELTFAGLGTDQLQVSLEEDLEMEDTEDSFDEYYADGMLYVTVYDAYKFMGKMEQEEYLSRFAPAAPLNESLYGEITAASDGTNTLIRFENATDGETWALPQGTRFVEASGTAVLDPAGKLLESIYTITYTCGGAEYTVEYNVEPEIPASVNLMAPDAAGYTEIDDIDVPRLYDTALFYMYASNAVTTNLSETIASQAAGCVWSTQDGLNYYGSGENHVSEVVYQISVQQGNQMESYTQTEHFQDSKYTVAVDGGQPEEQSGVSGRAMLEYCQNYLSENVISLSYISTAKVTEVAGTLFLELGYNEELGDWLCEYACETLFQDGQLLSGLATAYNMNACTGYMAVDKYTGMPTAIGVYYEATHTIDGNDLLLTLQADQSMTVASQTAYETVTGEMLPEAAPEVKASPLFYKVTGEDGQEMYLLGTIHIGDERTAFLPQEIYDALDASDALAVEFDTIAFEEQAASDANLAAQLAAMYLYSDGTATKDHLDEKTYKDAVLLLKASGNYNMASEMMKPSIWYQSITQFYLQQGYGLQFDKGVDVRLMKLAKEKGMEIRDIESGIFQVGMTTGYSDGLQAWLLESTLDTDPVEYYAESADLFEKWCAGDEAVLREAVLDDVSELTEDEMVLYEEYNKAMILDRNEGMLQVAIDYLESGDTVFYAVGLAHLLTGNGLVDTLRDAGYTVEPVTFR